MGRLKEFVKRHGLLRKLVPRAPERPAPPVVIYLGDHTILTVVKGLKMFLDTRDLSLTLVFRGMRKIITGNPEIVLILEFSPPMIQGAGQDPRAFLKEIRDAGFSLKHFSKFGTLRDIDEESLLASPLAILFLERRKRASRPA